VCVCVNHRRNDGRFPPKSAFGLTIFPAAGRRVQKRKKNDGVWDDYVCLTTVILKSLLMCNEAFSGVSRVST
jgi:hypothetical protein